MTTRFFVTITKVDPETTKEDLAIAIAYSIQQGIDPLKIAGYGIFVEPIQD